MLPHIIVKIAFNNYTARLGSLFYRSLPMMIIVEIVAIIVSIIVVILFAGSAR